MTNSEKIICGFIPVFLSCILWPSLPQITLTGLAVLLLVFCVVLKLPSFFIGILGGFIWASVCGYYYISWQFDHEMYHTNLLIEGEVVSLMPPAELKRTNNSQLQSIGKNNKHIKEDTVNSAYVDHSLANKQLKFNFVVYKAGTKVLYIRPKVRLSWFAAQLPLQQGDKLRLFVKIKPATGLANPDGFNYQTWLASKNIIGTGYVKASPSNQLLVRHTTFRQQWVNKLLTQNIPHLKWILSLSYGDRRLLKTEDWALMQRTGTAHLFAISGMHLGIVFICFLMLGKGVTLLTIVVFRDCITANIKPWLLLVPTVTCMGYSLIAGFGTPVLRALFTVLLCTSLVIFAQYWRTVSILLLLVMSFFILFPMAILGVSFWFSFVSVMIIIFYVWRYPLSPNSTILHNILYGLKLQLFISCVTLPIIAFTFSSLPIIAFIANLFMIPLVTFILVPLCLVAAILLAMDFEPNSLYYLISECFTFTFWLLTGLDELTSNLLGINWQQNQAASALIALLATPLFVVVLILVFFPNWPRKKLLGMGIFGLAIMHTTLQSNKPKSDLAWTLRAFDVGQGSAIVISDNVGTILHDTGGSFNGFSMANTVLMPFFNARRIESVNYVFLSHFDNDHAGGIDLIKNRMIVGQILSPKNECNRERFLENNPSGRREFLSFTVQVLWPLTANSGDENNQSCVIKLEKGKHSILLTGDIEKQAEAALLAMYKDPTILKADVLIAPHHGSKTSSTALFVNAVAPKFVIFTSGNHNRWDFPSALVVERYKALEARVLITGQHGRIKLDIDEDRITVSRYRTDEHQRWYYKAR